MKENITNIEFIENELRFFNSRYYVSEQDNIEQVLGTVYWLTWIPITPEYSLHPNQGIFYEDNLWDEDSSE